MKLLIAIMYPNEEEFRKAVSILENEFGKVLKKSEEFSFDFTDYYEKEFGMNLRKCFLVFEKEITKNDLIAIREKTGEIEEGLSIDGKRVVNIDPGFISSREVVLATKKGRKFKEELGKGVWAHKVLEFKDNEIITFYHTFADYKKYKEFFSPESFLHQKLGKQD